MRRVLTALSLASIATLSTACDQAEGSDDGFRANLDVDITMTMADGGSDDGTILWELGEGAVFEGEDSELLFYVEGNAIKNSAGITTCTVANSFLHSNVREVVTANGTSILFTVWRNYVFDGEVELSQQKWSQLKSQAMFEYANNAIYLGEAGDDFRLITTNVNLEGQTDSRKLLMAALLTGECGSAGIPGYTSL